jgi:hypothetical protein
LNYYVTCGFRHIGNKQLGLVPDLLPHYNNLNLALFENAVDYFEGIESRNTKSAAILSLRTMITSRPV